jgi:predicted alpha/beta hydrolase
MGGRRVSVSDRPAASDAAPLTTVRDRGGLWSFELHGETSADLALVLLPAMGVPAHYYDPLVDELLAQGVAVVRADFLAERVERDRSRRPDGFAALVEECLPAIFEVLRERIPGAKPMIVGHSLGGQLGLVAAARFAPETPVVLAASGSAWHGAFGGGRRWLYLVGSAGIGVIARLLGHWPGDTLGFGGRQPQAVIRDWSRVVGTGRYVAATGTFDYDAILADYRGEVLTIDVEHDVLAPVAATDALLAKTPRARVTRHPHTPARGTAKPGAHFTWVRERAGLAFVIVTWARSLDD